MEVHTIPGLSNDDLSRAREAAIEMAGEVTHYQHEDFTPLEQITGLLAVIRALRLMGWNRESIDAAVGVAFTDE